MSNEKFKVKFGLAVGDTSATVDGTTGDIVTAGNAAVNGGNITTTSTTANIINTNATTVNAFGAATTLNIGNVGGTTTVNGDLAVNGGDITTTQTTGTVFNTTATTVNIAGAGTTVSIGADTGTTTINNSLVADDISIATVNTTNLQVTNIKAKDGTAAATIANSTGIISVSSQLNVDNINISNNTISSTDTNGNITLTPNGTGTTIISSNITASKGQSITRTEAAGGKAVDANGDVLIINSTVNTTQLPTAAFFDNTTANRNGRVVVREYGQNTGSAATSATLGQATMVLEASRGTGASPTSYNGVNGTLGTYGAGYYDGSRWISESGIGFPVAVAMQAAEATAFETSSFTGSISTAVVPGQAAGTGTLTVTAVGSGSIHVGQLLTGTGVAVGTTIIAYGNNTFGSTGTYAVSFGQTTASTTITGVGTTAGGTRLIQLITPQGNKFSAASRQTIAVTAQTAPTTQTVNTVSVPVNASLNMINGNLETADATYVNTAGTVVYKARGGGTFQIPSLSLVMQGVPTQDTCNFTGYIDNGSGGAGNTLTVTAVSSGVLYVGQKINASALSNTTPYFITALGTGTGLTGTYTIASTFQTAGTTVGSSGSPVAMVGGPDDYGLVNKGTSIQFNTSRKSTVATRRAPLKSGDEIAVISATAQNGALGTGTTVLTGNISLNAKEDFTTSAAGTTFTVKTVDTGTITNANRLVMNDAASTINTDQLNIVKGRGASGGAIINIPSTTGELLLRAGDVNIMDAGSTWQSALSPGFKYTGLMSSSTQTGSGSQFEMSSRWKASAGTSTYAPPQSGWGLGSFTFSADTSTTNTNQINAGLIRAYATENWDSTHYGSRIAFNVNKPGTGGGFEVLNVRTDNSSISTDALSINDSTNAGLARFDTSKASFNKPVVLNGTSSGNVRLSASSTGDQLVLQDSGFNTLATIGPSTANFTVPVTTEITSTTINEGTTYTPAATVDNNISVQINALAGGTTVFDLASLTGNARGASYNILVYNNTGTGAPIQVKNTRISTNNLMTHTITTGNRIIINAYVVGDYATATHLLVA